MQRYTVTDILGRTFNVRFNNLDEMGALGNGSTWSQQKAFTKEHYAHFVTAECGTRINVAHIVTISPYGIPVPKTERIRYRVSKPAPIAVPDATPVMPKTN